MNLLLQAKNSLSTTRVLAWHYRFTDEELDFVINYDIKYRMGDELFHDGEEEED